MIRKSATEVRDDFAETLNQVSYGKERVVIHRRNKSLAAMVPIDDLKLIEAIEDRIDIEDARAALKEAEIKGFIPWEKVKQELGIK
jgi:prevent-host-death family protein